MTITQILKPVAIASALVALVAMALMTYDRGRGQCDQCGYLGDLHECKHCGWTACLSCWQRRSSYDTCPNCGRSNP